MRGRKNNLRARVFSARRSFSREGKLCWNARAQFLVFFFCKCVHVSNRKQDTSSGRIFFKQKKLTTIIKLTFSSSSLFQLRAAFRSGGNFSAPPRDDSEAFKTSVAGQSNWNAYEGSSEKELTPEEKKAKAKAEEDASNARRAAAAAKMKEEREKAGYKGSIF